jgi:hypothetical protein
MSRRPRPTVRAYEPKSRSLVASTKPKKRVAQRAINRVLHIANDLPKGHVLRRRLLASVTRSAAGWEDKAVAELAKVEGLDADDLKTRRGPGRNSIEVESRGGPGDSGEREWFVFKSDDDAERYALEYVTEMLEEEPELFTRSWLMNYVSIRPGDIGIIASEEADNYIEGIEDDEARLMDEADMESAWDKLEEQEWDLDDMDPEPDDYKARMKKIEDKKEELIEKAKDKLRERYESELEDRLENDPLDWLGDMGYSDMGDILKLSFVMIDTERAAKGALRDDGIAHFLDRYDGDATELRSGAIAYGTN